jgi:tRNA A37 threonylcarbamoyladenosine synthetase subunit TsaC/SUA5/YrdC
LIDAPMAPEWLLRANNMLAHRIPDLPWLKEVLSEVGPLIAPSANLEGLAPARTI